ncbi:MAG: SsrA RNA (tmRNA)-binding protein [uncultured bacterium]|nr:MAG: SsrA RNA (tmRNA)-binding protein [uncultured bacterium]
MSYKIVSENRKAYHNYEILETFEAGIVLSGKEIKAIRVGKVNLTGSYAKILEASIKKRVSSINKSKILNTRYQIPASTSKPELFLLGTHINVFDSDPTRTRKLLLHRKEISRLIGKTQEKNLTLIPIKIYLKNGKAKVELGLGRGKKLFDKREVIKKRDLDRIDRKNE